MEAEVVAVNASPGDDAVRVLEDDSLDPEARRAKLQQLANANPGDGAVWAAYGESLEAVGDTRTAMMAYQRASESDPALYTPWYRMGVLAKRGLPEPDYRRAEECFRKALACGAPRPQTLNELAVTTALSGRMKDAADLWRQAVDADPDWGVLYTNLFKALLSLGDVETVERYIPGAINAGRFEVSAILRVGDYHVAARRPAQAIALYDRALAAHPGSHELMYYRANALEESGDAAGARAQYAATRQAVAGAPGAHVMQQNIDFALFRIEHPKDERRFQKIRETVFNRYESGEELQRQMTRAIRDLDPLIEKHPTFWNGYFVRAKAHRMLDNRPGAMADLQKVLELVPDEPNATMESALVARDEGEFERAGDLAIKALELAPRDPLFAMNAGFVLVEAGQCDRAWECYRNAVRMVGPENAATLLDVLEARCGEARRE